MPELHPIQIVRYAGPTPGLDLTTKIAPPYDVLDEGPKQQLLSRDPHNIVAIDLPVTPPKTVGPDEAYDQAGRTYRQWLADGVLVQIDKPAVVAYEQVYTVKGRTFRRRELFANVKAEPFGRKGGGVHQHEHTIKGGIDDRFKLMNASDAQLSPVFCMFHDRKQQVTGMLQAYYDHEPDFHGTTGHDNVEHRCWVVDDASVLEALTAFFRETDAFIADGHHRYNTALKYAETHPDDPEAQRCLMVLVAIEDPGMIVLPTHRAITGLSGLSMDAVQKRAADYGLTITPTSAEVEKLPEQITRGGYHAMGLYEPERGYRYMMHSEKMDPLAGFEPLRADVWRKLDVAVLHHLFIERVLAPEFGDGEVGFKYTAEIEVLKQMCHDHKALGVIMQPTPVKSVCEVSEAGEVMPPKSTFFYPKLATGLVINPLR